MGYNDPDVEFKQCIDYSKKKKYEEANECLEIFRSRFPDSKWAKEAQLLIGDIFFKQKEYLSAAAAYNSFIKLQAGHPQIDYAYYRLGLSYLKQSPKAIDRDQLYLDDAERYLYFLLQSFPLSTYHDLAKKAFEEVRLKKAKRVYYIANFYFRTGEYKAAIPRFEEIISNYPQSKLIEKSLYRLVIAQSELLQMEEAKEVYSRLVTLYPDSRYSRRAEKVMLETAKKISN